MSLRIAFVAPSLEILGGQGIQAAALAAALRDDGDAVDFIPVNPRFPAPLRPLRRVRYARTVLNEALYVALLARLRRADVVHVFSASYWSFLLAPVPAIAAARALGRRVVLNYRSGEADDHLRHWGVLVHPWLRMVDEIVVPSEYLKDVFAAHGYRARVIPNVVDLGHFRYRERLAMRPRLVSTRNLERYYAVDNTLEAFALVRARYPQATLTLAGSGSESGRLHRLAERLGGRGIRFVGRVEPADMPLLLEAADIFVNSSILDNQPVSVLEAFAAGLPVVSTTTGGIGALLDDGERGVPVPTDDPGAMAKAVIDLVEEPARAVALTRRARAAIQAFTWSRVRTQWAAAYRGAAA